MHHMLIQHNMVNINVSQSSGFRAVEKLWCMSFGDASLSSPKRTDIHKLRVALLPEPATSDQLGLSHHTETDRLIEHNVI